MKLSNKIRPDCEAAPWVITEVQNLEARILRLETALETLVLSCRPKTGHTTIYYKGYHFGHAWIVPADWGPEQGDKWTFNRGGVCLENDWKPDIYFHNTFEDLLAHLEATFPEVELD